VRRLISAQFLEPFGELVAGTSHVASLEVEQPGGDLDQALVEGPLVLGGRPPQRFPSLVRVPVARAVEQRDAPPEDAFGLPRIERRRPAGRRLTVCARIGARRLDRDVGHRPDRSRPATHGGPRPIGSGDGARAALQVGLAWQRPGDGFPEAEAEALFVTPKAVEFHLANAYRKLAIGGRGELPAALSGDEAAASV
jgi:hypothetical protein